MTRIFLIRHAEAEGNLYRRAHGQFDSLITDKGLLQIAELGKRFDGERIDAVYSSDLFRARRTAAAIYQPRGLTLHTTKLLREVDMGVWEDRTWGDIVYGDPETLHTFNNDPANWHIPGSEDFYALQSRVTVALREIAEKYDGGTVAAVSHGCAIRAFLSGVLGIKSADIRSLPYSDNTAVALLVYAGGKFTVEYHGDNKHLVEAGGELGRIHNFRGWQKGSTAPGDENLLRFEGEHDEESERLIEISHREISGGGDDVYVARLSDSPTAVLRLDTEKYGDENAGWIAASFVAPEFRRRGIGVQILGQAVSSFRRLGRDSLRLETSVQNEGAIRFFMKYGFKKLRENGAGVVLEKDISRPFASGGLGAFLEKAPQEP